MSKGTQQAAAPAVARDSFPVLLEKSKGEIARVLPEGVSVERVCRMALTAWRMNAQLQNCTAASILASVMKAAELGLEPGGGLRQAWLIPFRDHKKNIVECTLQISVFGMLELARRSGAFLAIEARCVHENDEFSLIYDPRPRPAHKPHLFNPGAEVGAYAYGVVLGGEIVMEWMPRAEIERVRATSKSGDVWDKHWGQMACKTVLKRFLKRQPQSVAMAEAIEHDNASEAIEAAPGRPMLAGNGTSRAAQLGQRLRGIEGPVPAEDGPLEHPAENPEFEPEVYASEGGEAN